MINKSYQGYLKESQTFAYKHLSDAAFGFQQALDLCIDYLKDNRASGKIAMKRFAKFIIQGYLIMGKRKNYSKSEELTEEGVAKIYNLRKYIKENFIEEVIFFIAKYMTLELQDFVRDKNMLGSLELTTTSKILKMIKNDSKIIDCTNYLLQRDLFVTKQKVTSLKVKFTEIKNSISEGTRRVAVLSAGSQYLDLC